MNIHTKVVPTPTSLRKGRLFSVSKSHPESTVVGSPANLVRIIFTGTFVVASLMLLLLCISYFIGNTYVVPRIITCGIGILYLGITAFAIRKQYTNMAAWLIVGFYAALSIAIVWLWSINAQIGILMLGFVIILAGTLLGAKYIIPVTLGAVVALGALQWAKDMGVLSPDISSLSKPSTFADVASYSIIFMILALISWLSRRQMERALQRAHEAEIALKQEKQSLATRLEAQTKHLRKVQLEEMQQLYRFAELGQQSTAVLHELANYLTILTLDIDDIQQRSDRSTAITNAKESINYLDKMVSQVRRQIQENTEPEEFNAIDVLEETISTLQSNASKNNVAITLKKTGDKKDFAIMGDPLRLSQVVSILVTNAVDAYASSKDRLSQESIDISATVHASKILISVVDYGTGISDLHRTQLFEPFRSTKEKGMGIGLYIAKKMIETHFKGNIWIDPRHDATEFIMQLPRHKHKRHQTK